MNSIKNLRTAQSLSQSALAELLGLNSSTVAKWETGQSFPRTALLPKLAEIFGCTIDELLQQTKGAIKNGETKI